VPTYNEEIDNQVSIARTTTITAAPLDIAADHPLRLKGYTPVLPSWCVCVTDPCPYDDQDGPIIWIREEGIQKQVDAKRQNRNGDALFKYHIDSDSVVVTETFTPTKIASLRSSSDKMSALRKSALGRLIRLSGGGSPQAPSRQASGYYGGQECGGGTLYDVYYDSDGAGGTVFYYLAVGSC
jgi:hypothetical protein